MSQGGRTLSRSSDGRFAVAEQRAAAMCLKKERVAAARAQRSGSALYGKEVIRGATAAVRTRRRGAIRQRRAIARGMAVNGVSVKKPLALQWEPLYTAAVVTSLSTAEPLTCRKGAIW